MFRIILIPVLYIFLVSCILASCNSNWSSTASGIKSLENLPHNDFDSFTGSGSLLSYTTNNENALTDVSRKDGRYRANLENNTNDITLHFNGNQGRIDAKKIPFPFEVIARNIGIGTQNDSQIAPPAPSSRIIFSGLQVHVEDFNSINSSHIVVGHRGKTYFTVEGKNTVNSNSRVDDEGANVAPDGRADIRIIGNPDHTLTVYWQLPNLSIDSKSDNWKLYRNSGNLPGPTPDYGDEVYVGLITYAQGNTGVPFVGTCDSIRYRY